MKSCPLCSACSWGPIKNETLLPTIVWQILKEQPMQTLVDFVRCDNCGQIAQQALLEEPIGSTFPPGSGWGPIGPDPVTQVGELFKQAMALKGAPPTRTERLVVAMLQYSIPGAHLATDLVEYARALEAELDKDAEFAEVPAGCTSDGGGGIHWHFASRETFVNWLLLVLDRARDHCVTEGLSNFNINRVAKFVADLVCTEPAPRPKTRVWLNSQPRDFQKDFLTPALNGLDDGYRTQVSIALDCAIAFGALEAQTGNESLKLSDALENEYWNKVARLKQAAY